jgi:hypothetical protein
MIHHPEFLPALYSALRLEELLQSHKEAGELYCELYRRDLWAIIRAITHDISIGNVDAPRLIAQIGDLERQLSRLAAPGRSWN